MNRKDKIPAIETAYKYLASRMRTRSEVERHLREKGYSSDEISDAVNELIGMRYIDDYQYALRYYEYNRDKKRGSARAARELAEKGIDSETIRNAREDYLYAEKVDEYSDALAIGERELMLIAGDKGLQAAETDDMKEDIGSENSEPDIMYQDSYSGSPEYEDRPISVEWNDKLSARIARKLDSRGFDRSDIFKVLDKLRQRCESGM